MVCVVPVVISPACPTILLGQRMLHQQLNLVKYDVVHCLVHVAELAPSLV